MKIFNVSTVHDFFDTRIQAHLAYSESAFFIGFAEDIKSCKVYKSLGRKTLFNRIVSNFRIVGILNKCNRGDIVIFHDPELMFAAGITKLINNELRVVFDAHENILEDVKHKTWLNPVLRYCARMYLQLLMKIVFPKVDAVLTVTPSLVNYYRKYTSQVVFVPNFPISAINSTYEVKSKARALKHCYIGSISRQRGAIKICELAESLDHPLLLVGRITDKGLESEMKGHRGWENVIYPGYIPNFELESMLSGYDVGLLLLDDIDTFHNSYPVKIFDYVNSGLIIVWTGRSGCEYEGLVKSFPNFRVSEGLERLTFDGYLEHFFDVDQNVETLDFAWGNYYGDFIKCVES